MNKFYLLVILALFISCGKGSSSLKQENRINEQQIDEIMNNQQFQCASLEGTCPSGIARFFVVNSVDFGRTTVCTGFMTSANRMVTNNHCVATAEDCQNTFIAIYNGSNYERTRCKSIIKTQKTAPIPNDPRGQIDFTVLETADVFPGEVFQITSTRPVAGDVLRAWVVIRQASTEFPKTCLNHELRSLSVLW